LAVACAWLIQSEERYSIGVDIERVRHTRVAQSTYAFSRRERSILGQAPEGEMVAGLAAWTVKEAVWKALRPAPPSNPVEIEITSLCLDRNIATVKIGTRLTKRLRDRTIRARVCKLDGPDGSYLMAIAEILPSRPVKSSGPNKDRVHPVIRTLL
jgi:4'-phosphopantetheinyl transferase EntD